MPKPNQLSRQQVGMVEVKLEEGSDDDAMILSDLQDPGII